MCCLLAITIRSIFPNPPLFSAAIKAFFTSMTHSCKCYFIEQQNLKKMLLDLSTSSFGIIFSTMTCFADSIKCHNSILSFKFKLLFKVHSHALFQGTKFQCITCALGPWKCSRTPIVYWDAYSNRRQKMPCEIGRVNEP